MNSTGSGVKVSKSYQAFCNHIKQIQCRSAGILPPKLLTLRMKFIIIFACLFSQPTPWRSLLLLFIIIA